jgi:hypothetical protein
MVVALFIRAFVLIVMAFVIVFAAMPRSPWQ